MALAPWETTSSANTSVPIPTGTAVAPWETTPSVSDSPVTTQTPVLQQYATGIGKAVQNFSSPAVANTSLADFISAPVQAAASLASGYLAPASAGVDNLILRASGQSADQIPSKAQLEADNTYTPNNPLAQADIGLVNSFSKPVSDVLHHVAAAISNDPETQQTISDALGYALPMVKAPVFGDSATAQLVSDAPTIATHPAAVAANDLASKYGINLTKGQQVAQAASDLGPADTTTAKALNVPYQIEAKTATQATPAGKTYSAHFDKQQNILADQVQQVADQLRTAGDTDSADLVENAIVEKSPGISAVNGSKLQRAVDKTDIDNPALSQKLDDLNNLSGIIDAPAKGPIAPAGIASKITNYFGNLSSAAGATVGGVAGFKTGAILGHPFLGAELGASAGGYIGGAISNAIKGAPADLTTLTSADVSRMAKQAGISTDAMTKQLMRQPIQASQAASVPTGSTTLSLTPSAPRTYPGDSQAVTATPLTQYIDETINNRLATGETPADLQHQISMRDDPAYRDAMLLKAGIIEDRPGKAAQAAPIASATPSQPSPAMPTSGFTPQTGLLSQMPQTFRNSKTDPVRSRLLDAGIIEDRYDVDDLLRAGLLNDKYGLGDVYKILKD